MIDTLFIIAAGLLGSYGAALLSQPHGLLAIAVFVPIGCVLGFVGSAALLAHEEGLLR